MKKELQDKLYKDFPNLYQQRKLPMTQTCMYWGIETGDGWFDLIYELSDKITKIDPEVQAVQVKEKYGTLRFYVGPVDKEKSDAVYDIISEYESKSANTCEHCGSTDNVTQTQGWIVTLCDKCMKTYNKKRGFTDNPQVMSKSMLKRIKIQKGE